MDLFFSTSKMSNTAFPMFSPLHVIPLIMIICLGAFMIIRKKKLVKHKAIIKKCLGFTILMQQVLLYSWYLLREESLFVEALPLYLCRVVTICIVIAFIFDKRDFNFIIFYLGSIGSIIALFMPDTSGYMFPHVMYVQFFTTHGAMLLSVIYLYILEGYRTSIRELQKVVLFIGGYAVSISIINRFLKANYGYLEAPPASNAFFSAIPLGLIYKLLITGIMMLLPCFVHALFRLKPTKEKLNDYVEKLINF